jgi:hypothetical protein
LRRLLLAGALLVGVVAGYAGLAVVVFGSDPYAGASGASCVVTGYGGTAPNDYPVGSCSGVSGAALQITVPAPSDSSLVLTLSFGTEDTFAGAGPTFAGLPASFSFGATEYGNFVSEEASCNASGPCNEAPSTILGYGSGNPYSDGSPPVYWFSENGLDGNGEPCGQSCGTVTAPGGFTFPSTATGFSVSSAFAVGSASLLTYLALGVALLALLLGVGLGVLVVVKLSRRAVRAA